jgi:hypothetical protein
MCGTADDKKPQLVLRNAHFDAFQDDDNAWPFVLDLEGFRYDRLGGLDIEQRDDMRKTPTRAMDQLARARSHLQPSALRAT